MSLYISFELYGNCPVGEALGVKFVDEQKVDDSGPKPEELRSWLAKLSAAEKDGMLISFITGEDPAVTFSLSFLIIDRR